MWFVFELVIWPQEVTLARWTQPSGPLCLWQCFFYAPSLNSFIVCVRKCSFRTPHPAPTLFLGGYPYLDLANFSSQGGCWKNFKSVISKMLNLYTERDRTVFCTLPNPLKRVWSIVNSLAGIKRLLNWKRAKNAMYLFSSPASLSLILRPSHSLKFNSSFKLQS